MITSASAIAAPKMSAFIAVIVAELELRDVQRQVFRADFVERAHDAALEDAPEAFNRIGVDRADDVLPRVVIDRLVIVVPQTP